MTSEQTQSFCHFLRRFAFATDLVDEPTLKQIGDLAHRYVDEGLGIEFFEVMGETNNVDGEPGLKTLYRSELGDRAERLADDDGNPNSQTAAAFLSSKPLWIVPEDRETPLHECDGWRDLWSEVSDLPDYRRPTDSLQPLTSIIIPLKQSGKKFGALCLESAIYIDCTAIARHELEVLAEALTVLCREKGSRETSRHSTEQAMRELTEILNEVPFPSATRPQLFLATAARAKEDVVGCIKTVLEDYSSQVEIVHWRYDFSTATFVDQELLQAVQKSKFGICYLSEPTEGAENGDHQFHDNPNVVFEAGMLHLLTSVQRPGGWIPVRERDCPEAPFDIRNLQRVEVPRGEDGNVIVEQFKGDLHRNVRGLLGEGGL